MNGWEWWTAAVIVVPVVLWAVLNGILLALLLGRYLWLRLSDWIERDLARATQPEPKQAETERIKERLDAMAAHPGHPALPWRESHETAAALPRWEREFREIVEARWGNG